MTSRGTLSIAGVVDEESCDSLSFLDPCSTNDTPTPGNSPAGPLVWPVQSPRVMSGPDEDEVFDHQLPRSMRGLSPVHFTSVTVAKTAARMLAPRAGTRVLDVGAGPGKFCVVAAREVSDSMFVGVELRRHRVHLARKLAHHANVPNVAFIHGDAMEVDWMPYDAFYLYNPFAELLDDGIAIDRTFRRDPDVFVRYVAGVRQRLSCAPIGTRVVTYHGFGGPLPYGYELHDEHDACLQLWVKTRHVSLLDDEDLS